MSKQWIDDCKAINACKSEKLALLGLAEKRILCLCRIDSNDETVVDAFRIRKAFEVLKSEIGGDDA